jgi:hypothetical protein
MAGRFKRKGQFATISEIDQWKHQQNIVHSASEISNSIVADVDFFFSLKNSD